jgi:heptosyltransferase III
LLYSLTKHIKGKTVQFDSVDDILQRPIRVLISRPNSRLGNLLMVTPLVQEIERLLPNAKIDLFVRGGVGFPIQDDFLLSYLKHR